MQASIIAAGAIPQLVANCNARIGGAPTGALLLELGYLVLMDGVYQTAKYNV